MPGRWDKLRPVKPKELKATRLLRLPIDEVSAKIRSGPPADDKADLAWPVWGGLIPIETSVGTPQPDEHVKDARLAAPVTEKAQACGAINESIDARQHDHRHAAASSPPRR